MKCMRTALGDAIFWLSRAGLIVLLFLHEMTKTRIRRSFAELFYWPEGFCVDMVVVIVFFVVAFICVANDLKIFKKSCEN